MEPRALLNRLRQGLPLSETDLRGFAQGLATGEVSDAQGAAFAMAVCRGGLSDAETAALTRAMRDSGEVLHWDLPGPVLDKHSTGGIGDAVSLVLAPVLAAMGCYVPMLSGRGLGHTGGTLDKLETFRGVRTEIDTPRLKRIIGRIGCAIVAASPGIAPADRKLYALRDHTSTVESRALIVASILSKKLAAGAEALILDVKGGSGAFMRSREEAEELARALVAVAQAAGCPTRAIITDMNQPVCPAVGNAVELAEVHRVLTDPKPEQRLCRMVLALAGELTALAGVHASPEEGGRAALDVLSSGRAADKFAHMVAELGGPIDVLDGAFGDYLPKAPVQRAVFADMPGNVTAIDGLALGELVVRLGGGRRHPGDAVDHSVGLSQVASIGERVDQGRPLAIVHAADNAGAAEAARVLRRAMSIGEEAILPPLIHGRIDA
ncbi:thymidine phosphorylase [Mangrovicoccus algicola]|uniref:thymidine phosphorylase n=1 Tax=Mangrovicoccus algicola TaxID=2771008 RepID=A0A8J7CWT1_9RHOB|nr:thymidine phosphorylase [Mangrovicoccus algicola]MBE3639869.1 thymidine phosphorylase [Mangrovicoccus algicola]